MPGPSSPPQDSRTSYESESRALARQSVQVACVLAIVLVPAYALLDVAVFPREAGMFLRMRAACALFAGLILAVLQTSFGARHPRALGVVITVAVGLMIDVMTVFTGRDASPYYAGTNLVLLAVAVLMPWRAAWSLLTAVLLVGGYVACTVASGPITDWRMFTNNLAFLSTAGLIAVVGTAVRERLRAREFATRTALAETLRHKRDFMAKMSHELRTPLNVIIGYTDILLEDVLARSKPEARDLVERIRDRGVQLHQMISDLLDLAKVDAGKMEMRLEAVRVEALAARVVDGFRPLVDRKGLRLLMRSDEPSLEITTDPMRVEQILTNLVGNAVKFTQRGEIVVELRRIDRAGGVAFPGFTVLGDGDAAEPDEAAPEAGVAVLVRDTGVGIRTEDLVRLAADFQQADGTAERYGGTGLGLSISRKLARLLCGCIAVQSRHGHGSTFALLLPVTGLPATRAAA